MHHFIFEFITGGGLVGHDLSESLLNEGELMLQTLINELNQDDNKISICRDKRLDRLNQDIAQSFVDKNIEEQLNNLIKDADVCWLIAPETDGCLEHYTKFFSNKKAIFIGSPTDDIKLTSSKYLTNKLLLENNINAVQTKRIEDTIPETDSGWIIKPDDGAGAEDARLIIDEAQLENFVNNNYIIQPYIKGVNLSMSLLVCNSEVCLLACNKQYVDIEEDGIKLNKIGVNEYIFKNDEFLKLAKAIVSVIPGLVGYIGIDLIEKEGELFVLEINPRLTTAYVGLSKSIGINVANAIFDIFKSKKLPNIKLDTTKPVMVNI